MFQQQMNPQLAEALRRQAMLQGGAPPPAPAPVDPLAPLPEAPPPPPPPAPVPQAPPPTSLNEGINSVGRPADAEGADTAKLAEKAAAHDRLLKKLRRQGKGEALMAFGAAMLSAPNFGAGLSKGLLAYQQVYQGARERWEPKPESVANGAFDRTVDPVDQSVSYSKTPIYDYEMGKLDAVTGRQLAVADRKGENAIDLEGVKQEGRVELSKFEWSNRGSIAKLRAQTDVQVAKIRASAAQATAQLRADVQMGKPNSGIEKQVTDLTDTATGIGNTLTQAQPVLQAISSGKLKFGILNNAMNKLSLATGVGAGEDTVLYAQYSQFKEQLRNALLLANKGVQTDGDADRAMAEIEAGPGDAASIKKNLEIVLNSLQRRLGAANLRLEQLSRPGNAVAAPAPNNLRSKYGLE